LRRLHSSTAIAPHKLRFAQDMALHGMFEVWFGGSGFQVELCVERIQLEIIAVWRQAAIVAGSIELRVLLQGSTAGDGFVTTIALTTWTVSDSGRVTGYPYLTLQGKVCRPYARSFGLLPEARFWTDAGWW